MPWIFLFIAVSYEGFKSRIEIELRVFQRYFNYYLAYVYITSVTIAVTSLLVNAFRGNLDSFTKFLITVAQVSQIVR